MKYIILIILIGNNILNAQSYNGAYLKSCADLKELDAQIACTDSTLLEDTKIGWSQIKNEVEPGNYHVTYSIYSNGKKEANQIILVPQRVVLNSEPNLLLELVDNSVKKHEWVLPKCDIISSNNMKNIKFTCGTSRYLTINTNQL